MQEILYETIPSLDLDDFHKGNASKKQRFVETLGEAYNNIGFVAIRNHFLTSDMQHRLYDAIKKFFALPDEIKQKYELSGISGQRGYTGKGKEHAKGQEYRRFKRVLSCRARSVGGCLSQRTLPGEYLAS